MGKEARLKRQRRQGVKLLELEARQLLTATNNELEARLGLQSLIEAAQAKVQAMGQEKNKVFDALVKKYHLDPKQKYGLDDETLMLTPQGRET